MHSSILLILVHGSWNFGVHLPVLSNADCLLLHISCFGGWNISFWLQWEASSSFTLKELYAYCKHLFKDDWDSIVGTEWSRQVARGIVNLRRIIPIILSSVLIAINLWSNSKSWALPMKSSIEWLWIPEELHFTKWIYLSCLDDWEKIMKLGGYGLAGLLKKE